MSIQLVCGLGLLYMLAGCSVKEDLCTTVNCNAPRIRLKLKFTDAENKDLLFSENAPFAPSDLTVQTSLPLSSAITINIDSTERANKVVFIEVSTSQALFISLGNTIPNKLSIETNYQHEGCCGRLGLTKLILNNKLICAPCEIIQTIVIPKAK